jgi:hypothetical protein
VVRHCPTTPLYAIERELMQSFAAFERYAMFVEAPTHGSLDRLALDSILEPCLQCACWSCYLFLPMQ